MAVSGSIFPPNLNSAPLSLLTMVLPLRRVTLIFTDSIQSALCPCRAQLLNEATLPLLFVRKDTELSAYVQLFHVK